MTELEKIRKLAGWSRERTGVNAGVTAATCRMYELAGPEAIKDARKRRALDRTYATLRGIVAERAAEAA
jgi:hypothetical protein